jgi:hypothetical protein
VQPLFGWGRKLSVCPGRSVEVAGNGTTGIAALERRVAELKGHPGRQANEPAGSPKPVIKTDALCRNQLALSRRRVRSSEWIGSSPATTLLSASR